LGPGSEFLGHVTETSMH